MLAMVLEGAGYALECINITQFIYEETCQTGVLGVGSYISNRDLHNAAKVHFGPLAYAITGLWGFGVIYGALFPPVWLAFAYYWFSMTRQYGYYGNEIINGLDANEIGKNKQYDHYWKKECIDYIAWVYANLTKPEDRYKAFEENNPCKEFYRRYHNHHSPDDYIEFRQAVENYCLSGSETWNSTINGILDRCMDPVGNPQEINYMGNINQTNKAGPNKTAKNRIVKKIWRTFNVFQKLAYKNQPGGSSYFGFSLLYNQIWDGDYCLETTYTPPHWGFIQFGDGEIITNNTYQTMNDKLKYRASDQCMVIDSMSWDNGTGNFDPVAIIDLQTGKVTITKDLEGLLIANYISGKKEVWQEEIALSPKANETYYLKTVPIRWDTIYIKLDGYYQHLLGINPLWSLMIVRYPEAFTGGGILTFDTYSPVSNILFEVYRESDNAKIWSETTGNDGTIRLGIAHEAGLVTIKITFPDGTIKEYPHLNPEEATSTRYYNINDMP